MERPLRTIPGDTFRCYLTAWKAEPLHMPRRAIAKEAMDLSRYLRDETQDPAYTDLLWEWNARYFGMRMD